MPVVTNTSSNHRQSSSSAGSGSGTSAHAPRRRKNSIQTRRGSTSLATELKNQDDEFLDEMAARASEESKKISSNGHNSHSNSNGSHKRVGRGRKGSSASRPSSGSITLKGRVSEFWKTRKVVFFLGAFIGLAIAGYFTASSQDINLSLDILQDLSISEMMDDFSFKLPTGILKEARQMEKQHQDDLSEPFKIGLQLKEKENAAPKHPVIMIPGVISTGLESWSLEGTPECPTKPYFRKRLWGSWHMLRAMLLDKNCWLKNLMLDSETGLDPPNFKIRAAQGLDAADFFVTGYWIWNRILENLAAVGYDTGTMMVASYDWRLAYPDLEKRDRYFSILRMTIEDRKKSTGKKTVLISHSMGTQVVLYFLKWAEAMGEGFGNGGPSWVNDHIEAFIDISGSTLGTPKAIVALLSGEMKDTVQLNSMAVYGLEKFFSRRERADLLRTFGGIASMLPKGGRVVWGDHASAPDDYPNQNISFGNFIRFKHPKSDLSNKNLTIADSINYLMTQTDQSFNNRINSAYSFGLATTAKEIAENESDPTKWSNPLEAALPNAPDMKMFCFYGVGKPTERSYYYKEEENKTLSMLNISIAVEEANAVMLGEGDGTISLVTHAMCHKWKQPGNIYNPGNVPVKIVEMAHEPNNFDIRGGAKTADHVDILGRAELNELVLRVATGLGDDIEENIFSPLKEWTDNMDF